MHAESNRLCRRHRGGQLPPPFTKRWPNDANSSRALRSTISKRRDARTHRRAAAPRRVFRQPPLAALTNRNASALRRRLSFSPANCRANCKLTSVKSAKWLETAPLEGQSQSGRIVFHHLSRWLLCEIVSSPPFFFVVSFFFCLSSWLLPFEENPVQRGGFLLFEELIESRSLDWFSFEWNNI